ncbi:TetR/AcrR family transcriptional regulator [Streptomyces sp. NPDC006733]|uniref:TetR/AcrR family transcriptional regulator n=1 Tax=Streptomyces sp. NPDC006733 TaxID=3155460 RepID=UPI0033E8C067
MNRGRPRDHKVDEAVSEAVREILDGVGYQQLSIDRVAARAGVGKAGIYRRWRSKAEMVFVAVVHGTEIDPPPDRGGLRADLTALAEHILVLLSAPHARKALPGLIADIAADPELATRFAATFIDRQQDVLTQILERAAARGEIGKGADPVLVHAQLLGAVFVHLFLLGGTPPSDLPRRLADAVAAGLDTPE